MLTVFIFLYWQNVPRLICILQLWNTDHISIGFNSAAYNVYVISEVSLGRKEMFYLTTHSTHFIYGYMTSDIWIRTILIVKGNLLLPHRLLFPINSKGYFICTIPDRITHTTAFVTPVWEHWLEREIAQWVHPMKDRSDDPSHHKRTSQFRVCI